MEFRYKNIELKYMEKITRMPNKDGDLVIYVLKCKKMQRKIWKSKKIP